MKKIKPKMNKTKHEHSVNDQALDILLTEMLNLVRRLVCGICGNLIKVMDTQQFTEIGEDVLISMSENVVMCVRVSDFFCSCVCA